MKIMTKEEVQELIADLRSDLTDCDDLTYTIICKQLTRLQDEYPGCGAILSLTKSGFAA